MFSYKLALRTGLTQHFPPKWTSGTQSALLELLLLILEALFEAVLSLGLRLWCDASDRPAKPRATTRDAASLCMDTGVGLLLPWDKVGALCAENSSVFQMGLDLCHCSCLPWLPRDWRMLRGSSRREGEYCSSTQQHPLCSLQECLEWCSCWNSWNISWCYKLKSMPEVLWQGRLQGEEVPTSHWEFEEWIVNPSASKPQPVLQSNVPTKTVLIIISSWNATLLTIGFCRKRRNQLIQILPDDGERVSSAVPDVQLVWERRTCHCGNHCLTSIWVTLGYSLD